MSDKNLNKFFSNKDKIKIINIIISATQNLRNINNEDIAH